MGVLPTKKALEGFLFLCDQARKGGYQLSTVAKKCELKTFLAIQENKCVTNPYPWENTPTDSWTTTPETSWDDFLNQKKEWEKFEEREEKWFS